MKDKIALFCNVDPSAVFTALDVSSIYEVPLALHAQGLDDKLAELLNIWSRAPRLEKWEQVVEKVTTPKLGEVRIGVVGKYVELHESYKSLNEALTHGGISTDVKVRQVFIDSTKLEEGDLSELDQVDGILVPGGFGVRGTEGKILAVRWAREKKVPFFGICLGLQMAVIEFGRSVLSLDRANSLEFDEKTQHPVVTLMEGQKSVADKGGTMRLGTYPCALRDGTKARELYGQDLIQERHRHRFEFNNAYRAQYEQAGMIFSGVNPDLNLVEMIELNNHPHFVGCQFHPEFKSKPFAAHPLFAGFVLAAREHRDQSRRGTGAAVTKLPVGKI
jgi:CTP synthase